MKKSRNYPTAAAFMGVCSSPLVRTKVDGASWPLQNLLGQCTHFGNSAVAFEHRLCHLLMGCFRKNAKCLRISVILYVSFGVKLRHSQCCVRSKWDKEDSPLLKGRSPTIVSTFPLYIGRIAISLLKLYCPCLLWTNEYFRMDG